jgi:hypothetical protein
MRAYARALALNTPGGYPFGMVAHIKERALHRSKILENHLRTHVTDMFAAGGDQRDLALDELFKIYELNNNRGE